MFLTNEQRLALEHGDAVTVTVDKNPCVLLRADVYERVRRMLVDSDPTESYPAVLRAWESEGSLEDARAYTDLGRLP